MKRCILEGANLPDAAAVYRELTADLGFPAHFGHNPDALWDALSERRAEPVEIVWRQSARSAERLGPAFDRRVAVLHRAAAEGLVRLDLLSLRAEAGFRPGGGVGHGLSAAPRPGAL